MITVRYQQRTLYEPLAVNCMPDYQDLLWEGWSLKVDKFLEDADLVKLVREALEKRHPYSRTRGRLGTPAEVVLRLMALKYLRNWSYQSLEREVGAVGTRLRDRTRSVKHRLIEIGRSAMRKSEEAVVRRTEAYRKLMASTQKVMAQAKVFSQEVASGVKQASRLRGLLIEGLAKYLEEIHELAACVLKQTQARVLEGSPRPCIRLGRLTLALIS